MSNQYFENNTELTSNIQTIKYYFQKNTLYFDTDNGVFSKGGIDFGSNVLLQNIVSLNNKKTLLDVGCGYGTIGITLAKKYSNLEVEMVDVNLRALHLTERNAKENGVDNINVFESNTYQNISSKYSSIVTNPPIRAGKKVVYDIVMNAKDYLEENGKLFLVIRKEQGAKSLIVDLETVYTVKVLEKKKGFFILECSVK